MLQIATGRFFDDGKVNEGEFDSILFTNFSWIKPISTVAGELRPGNSRGPISSFVLRYPVRYEQSPNDILVLPVGNQVAEQFRLIAGLWFQAIFHPDRNHVGLLCRSDERHDSHDGVPSQFVDTYFRTPVRADAQSTVGFNAFLDKTVAMPRQSFRLFMSCLRVFFNALEAIDTNKDLAYSMFVYVLEGLTQGNDGFVPAWEDFPEKPRRKLDKILGDVPDSQADSIRDILSDDPHLKLMKRFMEFTTNHIEDSFFSSEAHDRTPAIPKNELQRTLYNLYDSRSGFVHALEQVQEHIRIPMGSSNSDYFHWDSEPHLTFSGLARLCRHVLLNFVQRQPSTEKEDYPEWRHEIPGIVTGKLAPELWIGRAESFRPEFINHRFSGFTAHLAQKLTVSPLQLADLRPLLETIEREIPQAKKADRNVMVCFYWLCHNLVHRDYHRPRWHDRVVQYKDAIEDCSIQMMASLVVLNGEFGWPVSKCESELDLYLRRKFKPKAIRLPSSVEVAVMSEIANMWDLLIKS